ncbi:MAG: hypothetical protein IKC26_02115 [Clostridia bacterium]|nr:hypothetical protein [Clostridia bacterium]
MSRLIKEDPLAVCPFFGGYNDHAIVCDSGEGTIITRTFFEQSDCKEFREDFCRCQKQGRGGALFAYPACPYYLLLLEERERRNFE